MKFEKKYVKISIAALAVVALVIGLSVGLTQKSGSDKNVSSSNAISGSDVYAIDNKDADYCSSSSGKSGKSGGSSGKSGKSGGSGGKSGKSGGRRRLVVPGTEEYVNVAGMGKRRTLRNEMMRRLDNDDGMTIWYNDTTGVDASGDSVISKDSSSSSSISSSSSSGKSGKSGSSGSSKSGKSGGSSSSSSCRSKTKDTCDSSSSSSSGKSGKSGGGSGKSGKSGGGSGKSGKSGGSSSSGSSACTCSSGKSGKSGGGKSGKSGGSGSGKSGKSGGSYSCSCDKQPTVCEPKDPSPTPAPTECDCESQPWKYDVSVCVRGCEFLDVGGVEYGSSMQCCMANFDAADVEECLKEFTNDECPDADPSPTPAPTTCECEEEPYKLVDVVFGFGGGETRCVRGCKYQAVVSEGGVEYDTLEACCEAKSGDVGICININFDFDECPPPTEPTSSPSMGSTPTVSTEITGPPTTGTRPVI
eukprot:CAMPEP_0201960406 /NCGR_PEP_ID=MMETSP0904-20121228/7134_1 /ASSEMBLY_ACC=CAM_ASM_000553 /TAXON_ID=420261 /ORGANISM="Thalassiosira antarctica, Strain CCMP982" /LENGTH=472 /DNA_ID=CAMNT_0048506353 /DNA_START=129 /DNA_END=1547 /DNA_ORIENTATION=+